MLIKKICFLMLLVFSDISFSLETLNFIEQKDYERDRLSIQEFIHDRRIGKSDPINVLSVDGGGVRGVIPAVFLEKLEDKTGRKVNELFDLFVGTSTGAILSLGLTTKKDDGLFRTASEMLDIYGGLSSEIFPSRYFPMRPLPIFGYNINPLTLPYGIWWGSEYSEKPLEDRLSNILGNKELKQISVPTVVTSVDAEHNTLKLFRSYRASWQETENFYVSDVARATSAAPTFFPIKNIRPVNGNYTVSLVDGGMAANNPSAIALSEAYSLFGIRQINLISLGTGSSGSVHQARDVSYIGRASPTIGMLFDAQSHTVDRTIDDLSESVAEIKYRRVQVTLEENLMPLDNADNTPQLCSKARNCFENGEGKRDLEYIIGLVTNTLKQRK